MGTSQSSKGSPPGVPMVPPWVPDAVPPIDPAAPDAAQDADPIPNPGPEVMAPDSHRFFAARSNLGRFAREGSSHDMKRGIKHFVQTGYGGASRAASRMARTAHTAGSLYQMLTAYANDSAAPAGAPAKAELEGRGARTVINAVIQAIAPGNGTQDVEATRKAISDALSDVLEKFPDADLLELTPEQRDFAIECYVAEDVFIQIEIEVCGAIRDSAIPTVDTLARLKEVRDYVRSTVSAAFAKLREAGVKLTPQNVANVASRAVRDTLTVFEGYT